MAWKKDPVFLVFVPGRGRPRTFTTLEDAKREEQGLRASRQRRRSK